MNVCYQHLTVYRCRTPETVRETAIPGPEGGQVIWWKENVFRMFRALMA